MAVNLALVLDECGLGDLDDDVRADLLKHLYASLETRVGTVMSAGLSNEQLDQFERSYAAKDAEETRRLISVWVPNHQQIVLDQVASLRAELLDRASEIREVADKRAIRALLTRRLASAIRQYQSLRERAYTPWPGPDDVTGSKRWRWADGRNDFDFDFNFDIVGGAFVTVLDAASVFDELLVDRVSDPTATCALIAYRPTYLGFDPPARALLVLVPTAVKILLADESVLVRTATIDGAAADVFLGPVRTMKRRPALVYVGRVSNRDD